MPTILRIDRFRFFFYSLEGNEPPHIHVESAEAVAKYWLNPVQLASNYKFRPKELKKIFGLIIHHRELFIEKWNEYFRS